MNVILELDLHAFTGLLLLLYLLQDRRIRQVSVFHYVLDIIDLIERLDASKRLHEGASAVDEPPHNTIEGSTSLLKDGDRGECHIFGIDDDSNSEENLHDDEIR